MSTAWGHHQPADLTLKPGEPYYVIADKKLIIREQQISDNEGTFKNAKKVIYQGKYTFGMNLTLQDGNLETKHKHRFYRKTGETLTGKIETLNLQPLAEQMRKVHMGSFKKTEETAATDPRKCEGQPWFQDLTDSPQGIKNGDWIYYQKLGGKVTSIGKNYQYKTVFLHEDTVPEDFRACRDSDQPCPRCALFGMTDERDNVPGLKGRFKASTLVNAEKLNDSCGDNESTITLKEGEPHRPNFRVWKKIAENVEVARQLFLPIQGTPKPNKRDDPDSAYYLKKLGMIAGAKEYIHTSLTMASLVKLIEKVDRYRTLKDVFGASIKAEVQKLEYSHDLRAYAHVAKEGLEFTGTLGAENCSPEEVAALTLLLEHNLSGHGFKIGLGKSFGLGSVISRIDKIRIRRKTDYTWHTLHSAEGSPVAMLIQEHHDIGAALETLSVAAHLKNLNRTEGSGDRRPLPLPPDGYWKKFSKGILPRE